MRQSAEVETQLISVERISEYSKLPPEAGYRSSGCGSLTDSSSDGYTKVGLFESPEAEGGRIVARAEVILL